MYESVVNEKIDLHTHKTSREQEFLLSGKLFDQDIKISDTKDDNKYFKDIINERMLFLYFSTLHCDLCIDNELSILKSRSEDLKDNLSILFYSTNARDIKHYQKELPNIPILRLDKPWKYDINQPYYFILDQSGDRLFNVFIPEKTDTPTTEKFLNAVQEKYF